MSLGNNLQSFVVRLWNKVWGAQPIAHARGLVVMEPLDRLTYLSVTTFNVDNTHSVVFVRGNDVVPGQIKLYLDTLKPTPDFTFTDPTGTDEIDAAGADVKFINQVSSADAPAGGFIFTAGSNGTLEIDGGGADKGMNILDSGPLSTTVITTDSQNLGSATTTENNSIGDGMSHIVLRPSDAGGAVVNVQNLDPAITALVDLGAGTGNTVYIGSDLVSSAPIHGVVTGSVLATAGNNTVHVGYDDDHDHALDEPRSVATVDFGAGSVGDGNTLTVDDNATAHVARLNGGTYTMGIATAHVYGDATLSVETPGAVGALTVEGGGTAILAAQTTVGTLEIDKSPFGSGDLAVVSVQRPSAIDSLVGGGASDSGGTLTFTGTSNPSTIGLVNFPGTINIATGAGLTAADTRVIRTLNVTGTGTFNGASVATINIVNVNPGGLATINAQVFITTATADGGTLNIGLGHGDPTAWGGNGATIVPGSSIGTLTITNDATVAFASPPDFTNGPTFAPRLTHTIGTLNLAYGLSGSPNAFYRASNPAAGPDGSGLISPAGTLDIGANQVLFNTPTVQSVKNIQMLIAAGYNASYYGNEDGDWHGKGITSAPARNFYDPNFGLSPFSLGWFYGGDPDTQDNQNGGQPGNNYSLDGVGLNQTLVRTVLTGDVNQDGVVDFNDISQILGYGTYGTGAPANYAEGDIYYHGIVNFDDITVIIGAGHYNTLLSFP